MKEKILVVENEEALRFLYEEELTRERYEVLTAGSGKEAIKKWEEGVPNLIVLDIVMPVMDGIEVIGRILGKGKTIPIILHTSHPEYRGDFRSWGADAFVMKSYDLTELKATIKRLLQGVQLSNG
jgi:DNA-binding response OmpR family regulator